MLSNSIQYSMKQNEAVFLSLLTSQVEQLTESNFLPFTFTATVLKRFQNHWQRLNDLTATSWKDTSACI